MEQTIIIDRTTHIERTAAKTSDLTMACDILAIDPVYATNTKCSVRTDLVWF